MAAYEELYAMLRRAVADKLQVAARYQGYDREFCPHAIGWAKDGTARVLGYQFGGKSPGGLAEDGSPDNWRCFDINGLRLVQVRTGEWHTAPTHQAIRGRCLHRIDDVGMRVSGL